MPYLNLMKDGNSPGLRVCQECWDMRDPYRLPPLQPDAFALQYPRPLQSIVPNQYNVVRPPILGIPNAQGGVPVVTTQYNGVIQGLVIGTPGIETQPVTPNPFNTAQEFGNPYDDGNGEDYIPPSSRNNG
jgi:hypothetical protein